MHTEMAFRGAAEQARLLATGAISAPELVEGYLDRIAHLDGELNAFRVVRADAARAEALDAQRRLDAGDRQALLGVPIVVKDDTDVAGELTTRGTGGHGPPASLDAPVVQRLRDEGAIVIGKTNVPELCLWTFTESTTFGATRNPWDPTRSPGGSSGGTATAIAAGLAALGLGTDGGGSIRTPAAWCGLFGLKPQRGRVPLASDDDGWHGLMVAGPLTRTVEDAALFLDVTSTIQPPGDGFVAASGRPPGRLRVALHTASPLGPLAPVERARSAAVHEAGSLLRELGHEVVDHDLAYPVQSSGWNATARYLRGVHDDAAALPHPDRLEPRSRRMARLGGRISDRRIAVLRRKEVDITERVLRVFDEFDVVITPATATGPPVVGAYAKRGALATLTGAVARRSPFAALFNVTGQPAAVVPWGIEQGLPTAVQLVGRPHDEALLLSLSAQIEAARPWSSRRPPVS